MLTFILLIFCITFATYPVSTQNNGVANIQSFRKSKSSTFDGTNYYISENKVQWTTAHQSCKNLFGSNSSTVSVRTVEEWSYLKSFIGPQEFETTYWTGGMYDRNSNVWRWSDSSILMPWAPWDNNHPSSNPSSIHRVLIAQTNLNTASWRTVSNTQSHRFICEVPNAESPIPITCSDIDLFIVLDSSASIGSHNFRKAKKFSVKLASEFTGHNTNRIGFSIFSDKANTVIDLNNTLTPDEIGTAISDAPYLKDNTATHVAIEQAVTQFQSSPRNVTKLIVVITDGESTDPTLTSAAVDIAKNLGIRTFSVGVTTSADKDELLVIGGGDSDSTFVPAECDNLIVLVEPITRSICPDV